jgi:hypothetical protein
MPPAKEENIFNGIGNHPLEDTTQSAGVVPGEGTFYCLGCGIQLSLRESESLPICRCGSRRFRRDSIFAERRHHSDTTTESPVPAPSASERWVEETRGSLSPGPHLVLHEGSAGRLDFPIERGWTRIGRSPAAEVCLDDPSVSRRHAMVVAEPGRKLRVFDDRSLNGVLLNGEEIEWGELGDGDELTVGRYRIYLLYGS